MARTRRGRATLVVAVLASACIVGAWFPLPALLHQHEQLASASAQLSRLDRENAALRHQEKQLRTLSTLGRIAQGEYGLVPAGDQAYQVLPPSGTGTLATGKGGDGSAQARSRKDAPAGSDGSSGSGAPAQASFFGRVLQTLEFWR